MSEHTQTPWRLKPSEQSPTLCVYGADGMRVACVPLHASITGSIDEHNAVFMVRAVNSHNELVAALKDIVEWEASEGSGVYIAENPTAKEADQYMKVIGRAVAAITLAERDSP